MTPDFLQPAYRPEGVVLSGLIAVFTSYVALDLSVRVRSKDKFSARVWTVGGALVMGSGIWSMHFVGMLALLLPFAVGYEPLTTCLSWVAAVGVSWLALRIASGERLTPRTLLAGAGIMGGGICAMHYLGMAAQRMAPGIVWDAGLVAASAAIACTASAVALAIVFGMRRLAGMRARAAQAGAALVMGAAIAGMHYTGMAAAGFAPGSVCLSSGGLGGQGLGLAVVLGAAVLLSLTLFISVLDARMESKAGLLTTSLQEANARLNRMVFLDPLTGIPNRLLFEDRLGHAAARIDRASRDPGQPEDGGLGLLFIDLDSFQPINDSYGHATGDAVLRLVAERLAATARGSDTLARIGGDEFVLLVEEIAGAPHALALAERVLAALAEPFELEGRRLLLSCSIGVALYPQHGTSGALLTNADAAMHAAKRAGGNTVAVFEAPMRDDIAHHLELQQTLREAIERGQLQLHYQSKIDAASGEVCGAEALLRWTHPTRGPISPAVFIPIAERSGLIMPIGNWVIDEACRQLAAWQRQGRRMRVSINLSAHQLRHRDVVDRLRQAMARHGVGADQIVCEITESVAMQDTRATQNVIEELNALGVKLSIDDFGTGYSSLGSLRQLHAHELKIDRSFVRDVATDVDALAVVDAVVRLAQALGMRVVAEGVETLAQRDVLVSLGCDELQGFYFARPVSAETFVGSGEPPRVPALQLAVPLAC